MNGTVLYKLNLSLHIRKTHLIGSFVISECIIIKFKLSTWLTRQLQTRQLHFNLRGLVH